MNISVYAKAGLSIFSLGFGLGKLSENVYEFSVGLGFIVVGIQFIKTPKASDLMKELEDNEVLRGQGEDM